MNHTGKPESGEIPLESIRKIFTIQAQTDAKEEERAVCFSSNPTSRNNRIKAINKLIHLRFFWIFLLTPFVVFGQTAKSLSPTPIFGTQQERCILPAAQYHMVNPLVLRAVLNVESSLQSTAIHLNANGTVDVGMGQINSIHFQELAKWGITPQKLMDACVSTYVAAWHLKKGIVKYGNTWFGIAAYHSVTPEHNAKYQSLIYKELVKTGAFHASPGR